MGRSEVLAPKGVLKFVLYPITKIAYNTIRGKCTRNTRNYSHIEYKYKKKSK